ERGPFRSLSVSNYRTPPPPKKADLQIKPLIKQQQQQISKADVKDQEIEIIDAWELMKGLEVEDRSNPSSTSPLLLLPDSHASTFLANEAIDMDEKMVHDGEVTSCSISTLDDDSPKFHWMESDNLQQHSSHRTFYEQQQESATETTNSEMQKSVSLLTMRCTKKKTSSCEEVSPIDVEEQKDLDPLSRYELKCPPGGQDRVVLYTTSLRGIRKTFESCNTLRMILESFNVYVDERDVSMHAGFREELKALFGKPVPVPRVFIKGHYIGGAEEVFELHEDGLLIDLVKTLPVRISRQVCDCCGGIRFVPCTECNGSCKILTDTYDVKRCPNCNENGLIRCTLCS
ncbi:unnamed protein product, partial [Sphagnum jensenii]